MQVVDVILINAFSLFKLKCIGFVYWWPNGVLFDLSSLQLFISITYQ